MCKKEQPQSTQKEITEFFDQLQELIKNKPKDVVMVNLAMVDLHRHDCGPMVVAAEGSRCALGELVENSISQSNGLKKILSDALQDEKRLPPSDLFSLMDRLEKLQKATKN